MPPVANGLQAASPPQDAMPGDLPERIRRRYLADRRGGPGVGYYVDAITSTPAFRDTGRRLTAARSDPHVIRDLVAIARHRGWSEVQVTGEPGFRREIWMEGRRRGLDVQGYRPTERDRQALDRATRQAQSKTPPALAPATPLAIVETVVRSRIVEPAVRARIMAAARERLVQWLERGARLDEGRGLPKRSIDRSR